MLDFSRLFPQAMCVVILSGLPRTDLSMLVISNILVSTFMIWQKAPESPINVCFVNMENNYPLIVHIRPVSSVVGNRDAHGYF